MTTDPILRRICSVSIENAEGKMDTYEELDVKFNITNDASGYVYGGTISVCNLTSETIMNYVNVIGILDWKNRRRISLSVGDREGKITQIFNGRVLRASVTIAPEVWITFFVMSEELCSGKTISISESTKSLTTSLNIISAIQKLANQMGLGEFSDGQFKVAQDLKKKSVSLDCLGSYTKIKHQIENCLGGGSRIVVRNGSMYVINTLDPSNNPLGIDPPETIEDSVIIGMPKFDFPNVSVDILLNPNLCPLQNVKLNMTGETSAHNGLNRMKVYTTASSYYINTISHFGHFRGDVWKSTINLVNKSNIADILKEANKPKQQ